MPILVPSQKHLGRFRLGETVKFRFVTRDGSGTPTAPDAHPSCKVYGPDESLEETIGAVLRGTATETGLFVVEILLDSDYGQYGMHDIVVTYDISAATKGEHFSFEIIRGGASGLASAMAPFNSKVDSYAVVQFGTAVSTYPNPRL